MDLSWDHVVKLSSAVAKKLQAVCHNDFTDTCLYAIPRGGMPVATLIAHWLDLHDVYPAGFQARGKNVIVIDDIADSGSTLEGYVREVSRTAVWNDCQDIVRVYSATLLTRYSSKFTPTVTGLIYPADDWIVFPWEVKGETEQKRDQDRDADKVQIGGGESRTQNSLRPDLPLSDESVGTKEPTRS